MISVLIVEDYDRLRSIYEQLLAGDPAICCVGRSRSAREAFAAVRALSPDVVLLDISLPDANGLEVARELRAASPGVRVVILGEDDSEEYRAAARTSGAWAYLKKEQTTERLVPLILGLNGGHDSNWSRDRL